MSRWPVVRGMGRVAALVAALGLASCAELGAPVDAPAEAARAPVELAGTITVAEIGRGAYGLPVHLLFLDAADAPLGRPAAVDTLDEAGRFRLVASAPPGAVQAVVVGGTRMRALRLVPSPPGGVPLGGGERSLPLATAIRVPLGAGGVRQTALAGQIPARWGLPVRMLTLSREFVVARYAAEGQALPFPLPAVRVELSDGGGYVFQPIDPDSGGRAEIEVNASGRGFSRSTLAHEYGHYVSFRMWGSSPWRYALRNRDFREGWAVFFSFAARAYAAAAYGEAALETSNTERAAFTDLLPADGPARRYRGIAYGTSRPTRAATGALLWSWYDTAETSPFEPGGDLSHAGPPGPGDNDDLGLGLAVFEATRATRASLFDEAGLPEVLAELRRRTPPEQHASLDGAAGFFLCPALVGCDPVAAYGAGPRAPTRTLRPTAPGAPSVRVGAQTVTVSWERFVYTAPWANAPARYRVRRDGRQVAEVPGTVALARVAALDARGVWTVEAVGADGAATVGPERVVGG